MDVQLFVSVILLLIWAFGKYYSPSTVTMVCFRNSTMKTLFLALVAILSLEISAAWKNDWDQPLAFKCPSSNSQISQIVSIHDNNKEDRLFDFGCRLVDGLVSGPISCRISGMCHYVSPHKKIKTFRAFIGLIIIQFLKWKEHILYFACWNISKSHKYSLIRNSCLVCFDRKVSLLINEWG